MRKIVAGILIVVLILSLCATSALAAEFSDVPAGKWYTEPVKFCVDKGFVSGYKDGTFKPNQHITRGEFAVIMNKFCYDRGLFTEDSTRTGVIHEDVLPGKWYTQPVINCIRNDIMSGYSSTKFGVNEKLTREQAAVIFAKALSMYAHHNGDHYYRDWDSIHKWARNAVGLAYAYGFMTGTGNDRFEPLKPVTRAEVATIIQAVSKISDKTIRIENCVNNAIVPTYVLYERGETKYRDMDFADSKQFWSWIAIFANNCWTNDITDSQVRDAAYALLSSFDGNVPAFNPDDFTTEYNGMISRSIEYKNGKYHFMFGNWGEDSHMVGRYIENSDGSVDVMVGPYGRNTSQIVEEYKVHMVPNEHVHIGAEQFEYYYTIEDMEYLK